MFEKANSLYTEETGRERFVFSNYGGMNLEYGRVM